MTVHIRGAERRFRGRTVFSGLDLSIATGERVFVGGANGSGKSTLLRCLAGTLQLSAGSIDIDGFPPGSRHARAGLGLCLNPEAALYTKLSGHENLIFAARLAVPACDVAEAVDLVEQDMGISEFATVRVQQYSSGMRARVAIARALLGRPTLLVLDEPTRSLDHDACDRLWAAVDRRGVTCVLASHHHADRSHCDTHLDMTSFR